MHPAPPSPTTAPLLWDRRDVRPEKTGSSQDHTGREWQVAEFEVTQDRKNGPKFCDSCLPLPYSITSSFLKNLSCLGHEAEPQKYGVQPAPTIKGLRIRDTTDKASKSLNTVYWSMGEYITLNLAIPPVFTSYWGCPL